jgi:hypothetical protein
MPIRQYRNYWVVLCRKKQHDDGGYPIRLVEVDPNYPPAILDSFERECPECKEKSVYKRSDLREMSLPLLEGWKPDSLFRRP